MTFAKYHPARWSTRTLIAVILAVGSMGLLTGCNPADPMTTEECADAVADHIIANHDDAPRNDADLDRLFKEVCGR